MGGAYISLPSHLTHFMNTIGDIFEWTSLSRPLWADISVSGDLWAARTSLWASISMNGVLFTVSRKASQNSEGWWRLQMQRSCRCVSISYIIMCMYTADFGSYLHYLWSLLIPFSKSKSLLLLPPSLCSLCVCRARIADTCNSVCNNI